jgi:hypothetical protein
MGKNQFLGPFLLCGKGRVIASILEGWFQRRHRGQKTVKKAFSEVREPAKFISGFPGGEGLKNRVTRV